MTSLQIRLMAVLKTKGISEPGTDLDFLEENLINDITTREAIEEALEGLVAEKYLEEKAKSWSLTPKGAEYISAELSW